MEQARLKGTDGAKAGKGLDDKTRDLCVDILRELAMKLKSGKLDYTAVVKELQARASWIEEMYEFKKVITDEQRARND